MPVEVAFVRAHIAPDVGLGLDACGHPDRELVVSYPRTGLQRDALSARGPAQLAVAMALASDALAVGMIRDTATNARRQIAWASRGSLGTLRSRWLPSSDLRLPGARRRGQRGKIAS